MGEGVLEFFKQDSWQELGLFKEIAIKILRLCTFLTQAFLRTQDEIALSSGVFQILCKIWSLYQAKLLITDLASDILGVILLKDMGSRLAIQSTRIDPCHMDEHSKIGSAERAISELDCMIACSLLDSNLPPTSWDLVGEHVLI